jgi:hypothetical protein
VRPRQVQSRTEREIRHRQGVAGDDFPLLQLAVEHLGCAMKRFGALGDCGHVGFAIATQQPFGDILEGEHGTGGIPVGEVRELPARDIQPR